MHRPSLKYEEVREDVKKSLREYLDKLTSIESELTALDELLTAELAKPPASNTLTSRYIFTQKAQRLEDMLVHLLD
jgi:DNA-binding transcriptional regulator YbjK